MKPVLAQQRRVVARKPGDTVRPVRLSAPGHEASIVATVRDISVTGIGILSPQPLKLGTWFVLEPSLADKRLDPELKVEVRHSTRHQSDYVTGCRFSRLLT